MPCTNQMQTRNELPSRLPHIAVVSRDRRERRTCSGFCKVGSLQQLELDHLPTALFRSAQHPTVNQTRYWDGHLHRPQCCLRLRGRSRPWRAVESTAGVVVAHLISSLMIRGCVEKLLLEVMVSSLKAHVNLECTRSSDFGVHRSVDDYVTCDFNPEYRYRSRVRCDSSHHCHLGVKMQWELLCHCLYRYSL